jgi:hypothetical protein
MIPVITRNTEHYFFNSRIQIQYKTLIRSHCIRTQWQSKLSTINIRVPETWNIYFDAMNSVHFCSITLRSNEMHYFYYLKLKNYLQYIALIHYKLSLVFQNSPDMFRRQSRAICNHRRRVDAGQNSHGTDTNSESRQWGRDQRRKNHGTTAAQHT